MDLNNFLSDVEKKLYKITFMRADEKIKRFIRATSEENAKYLLEQDVMKENNYDKFRIIDIEDISKKQQVIKNVQGLG